MTSNIGSQMMPVTQALTSTSNIGSQMTPALTSTSNFGRSDDPRDPSLDLYLQLWEVR